MSVTSQATVEHNKGYTEKTDVFHFRFVATILVWYLLQSCISAIAFANAWRALRTYPVAQSAADRITRHGDVGKCRYAF
jgi:hypothetical protein